MIRKLCLLSGSVLFLAFAASAISAKDKVSEQKTFSPASKAWTLESDESIQARENGRYLPPKPRRGFYAHGFNGAITESSYVDLHDPGKRFSVDLEDIADYCRRFSEDEKTYKLAPLKEFWYFESRNEGVLLTREAIVDVKDCKPGLSYVNDIFRIILSKKYAHLFRSEGRGNYASVTRYAYEEFYRQLDYEPKPGIRGAFDSYLLTRIAMRKRRFSKVDPSGKIGNVKEDCFGTHNGPHIVARRCWVSSSGPARGLTTGNLIWTDGGGHQDNFRLSDVQNNIKIDGRLFEWDRRISFLGDPEPAKLGAEHIEVSPHAKDVNASH